MALRLTQEAHPGQSYARKEQANPIGLDHFVAHVVTWRLIIWQQQ